MRFRKLVLGAAVVTAVAAIVATAPFANAITGGTDGPGKVSGTPRLVNGEPRNSVKWIAKFFYHPIPGDPDTFGYCSAAVINAWWALTARHCISGPGNYVDGNVVSGNETRNVILDTTFPGIGRVQKAVTHIYWPDKGDIALMHLESKYEMPLADGSTRFPPSPPLASERPEIQYLPDIFDPRRITVRDMALVYGFGMSCADCYYGSPEVRVAGVDIREGSETDPFGGRMDLYGRADIEVEEHDTGATIEYPSGLAEHGDSGGPVVDLKRNTLVGVVSEGDDDVTGVAPVYTYRNWIFETMGL